MSESTNERLVQVLEELGIRLPYPLPAEGAHEMDQLSPSRSHGLDKPIIVAGVELPRLRPPPKDRA